MGGLGGSGDPLAASFRPALLGRVPSGGGVEGPRRQAAEGGPRGEQRDQRYEPRGETSVMNTEERPAL